MNKQTVEQKIKDLNKNYNVLLTRERVYVFNGEIFISTKDSAKFLGTDYHNFCSVYSHVIIKKGKVRMTKLARAKFYNVDDLIKLFTRCIKARKSVLQLIG